ncbi:hypothetical protein [Allostreptomyces psammosilenae]|uniref:Uncharacterized protein n=1 Tax=Allostreptomyces psammosilenae TaxID=1892865 RepID=A0A852ZQL4_9ACTN|nr:hypothetical protein [Allostreptomyces psammosilenae]NYI04045.1 hypothetical protein [Allostreptomyces psammosilenae]
MTGPLAQRQLAERQLARLAVLARVLGAGGVLTAFVMATVFGWLLLGDGEAEAAPADLCRLVEAEDLRRIVPQGVESSRTDPWNAVESRAYCEVLSPGTPDGSGEGPRATLYLGLTRHGDTRTGDGWGEAREAFTWSREYAAGDRGAPEDLPGVGEAAFVEVAEESGGAAGGRWVTAEVTVLLGRDLLTVDYSATPTDPARARAVAVAVAERVLGRL